jgi:hypothetical protein
MKRQETKKDYVDAIKRFMQWSGIKKELRKNNQQLFKETDRVCNSSEEPRYFIFKPEHGY